MDLASIFAQSDTPEFDQSFLPRQKHPPNTADLFANIASSSEELRQLVSSPEGFGDDDILSRGDRLRCRGALASAWRLAEASFKNKKSPSSEEKAGLIDAPIDLDRRTRSLSRFQDVYRFAIPVSDQPIDRALSIANHLWAKRAFEFAPLSAASA